jgi:16S rRNA (guanine527-N7)-methyltransferase
VIAANAEIDLQILREGCRELGISLLAGQEDRLLRYLELLYVWNRAAGLTTIARENAVRLHLLDCLAALSAIDRGPCLDLGTGAGLPGIVAAIASPSIEFVLAESNRKRCSFLLETVRVLELPNVRLIQGDVASLPRSPLYPLVISRAFRPPAEFLAIAGPLVAPSGRVVLLMADPTAEVLNELSSESGMLLAACTRFHLPVGREPRAIVSFQAP